MRQQQVVAGNHHKNCCSCATSASRCFLIPVNFAESLVYLDEHASYEKTGRVDSPSTLNIETLLAVLGDPQNDYRVIHVTGTNGKGSTSQIITKVLMAHGLKVGTYSSPHLENIRERIQVNGEAVAEYDFAEAVAAVANAEGMSGVRPTYFEIMTAAAFRWFSDDAIDVAVIEVGMLGRWDATNVVHPDVAVITNIALDHTEFAGPTLAHIAKEKAGIIKEGSVAVIGETNEDLHPIFSAEPHEEILFRGEQFDVVDNHLALGGRSLHVRTARADYIDLFLPLHGWHQGDNAAVAIAAVESFFGNALDQETLQEGLASVLMPGRFEVVGHQPLVILDGAHNMAGAEVCASVFFDDFDPHGRRILVVGALGGRDIADTLSALKVDEFDRVICCTAPSPRALPAKDIATAAEEMGGNDIRAVDTVEKACDMALNDATSDDAILIAGSLYVVGAARTHLRKVLP
ncbi:MAG: bifunctional folylpolyglutamate synthase/dihydrofolate synthase [Actinobacteria bacterium]|nr:bifunctional folylpolyglutamate synthase/dihydrofolate synthase [Actinomycetota bacterium]